MKFTETEHRHMERAILLALRALGNTSPNPMVGCVLVKNGKVIAEGYHKKAGLPHAEVEALTVAGAKAKGSTAFVTLEPCSHTGRTGPCCDALIEAGVKEVVVAMKDPNPLVAGRGIRRMQKAGIKVRSGLMETEAKSINTPYIKRITTGLPYVTLKVAISLDGKMADSRGYSKWISGGDSRKLVHRMRAACDGIMTGVGTVIKDDPQLNVRPLPRSMTHPARIVLDSRLRISPKAKLFASKGGRVIIATGKDAPEAKAKKLEKLGAEIIRLPLSKGRLPLKRLLKELAKRELMDIMLEGGPRLLEEAITKRLADSIAIFIAPKMIGGGDRYSFFKGASIKSMEKALKLKDVYYTPIGDDILVEGTF